jgi:hypothetical protein
LRRPSQRGIVESGIHDAVGSVFLRLIRDKWTGMNRHSLIIGIAIVIVLVVVGAAVTFLPRSTEVITPEDGEAPPITGVDRAEDARSLIAELEQEDDIDYDAAFAGAQAFQAEGRVADAQLLYFYAARAGHGPSAFALATMNDPNHHSPSTSLLPEPDPFQAFRWYTAAREQGVPAVDTRLQALREWAEKAYEDGDQEAEQLLLQWE